MLKHLCFFSVSWSFLYIINTGWYEFCLLFTKSSICEQIDSTSIYTIIQLVQSLSCVRLFVTPWTAAHQTSLFITNSQSLCKLMSIESMMPCNFLISVIPFSHLQSSVLLLASINLQLHNHPFIFSHLYEPSFLELKVFYIILLGTTAFAGLIFRQFKASSLICCMILGKSVSLSCKGLWKKILCPWGFQARILNIIEYREDAKELEMLYPNKVPR